MGLCCSAFNPFFGDAAAPSTGLGGREGFSRACPAEMPPFTASHFGLALLLSLLLLGLIFFFFNLFVCLLFFRIFLLVCFYFSLFVLLLAVARPPRGDTRGEGEGLRGGCPLLLPGTRGAKGDSWKRNLHCGAAHEQLLKTTSRERERGK